MWSKAVWTIPDQSLSGKWSPEEGRGEPARHMFNILRVENYLLFS